jgi:saccharopine dehydrogenase-like NADP-dependent oxidoreductase
MASRTVLELASEPGVEAITIADYDLAGAQRVAVELTQQLGPPGVLEIAAVHVDADDHGSLVDAIKGHDVAASGIGPFYRYEVPVARAAIEAGVPYVSLCDDYDAAQDVLELDEAAREAGVTVLTGLGWTPGLSNVLARKGAEQMDQVDEIRIAWGSSASDSDGYAVILHTMHIFSGDVPTRLYGWSVDVPAGSDSETVLFPAPVGAVNCYHVGHPEPVTLPRHFPDAQTVTLKGGLSEQPLNELAIWLARLRLTDTPAKRDALGQIIKSLLPVLSRFSQPAEPCSAVRVNVKGRSNGEARQVSYAAAGHMRELTGLPLAIGALMLARGEIHAPGVVAPESCIEPNPFLAELETRGVSVHDLSGQWPTPTERPARLSSVKPALIAAGALILLSWLVRRRRGE